MKKTIQVSIARTLFTIEEDGYSILEKYLSSIKKHFKDTDNNEEITADIENRIAEQLVDSQEKIITISTIQNIINSMGHIEDFDEDAHPTKKKIVNTTDEKTANKKLYRNTDTMVIAGVCSGLAAYFNIEVVLVRIIFMVLLFANGIGILAYIILWIAMPEAKTKSQKLEMMGSPVNLETLADVTSESSEEINPKQENMVYQLGSSFFRSVGMAIRGGVKIFVPTMRILTGFILCASALLVCISIMIAGGFIISYSPALTFISSEIPFSTVFPGLLQWVVLIAAAFTIIIPTVFLFFLGLSLLQNKKTLGGLVGLSLLGVWLINLAITGFGAAQGIQNYENITSKSPLYQPITREIPLSGSFDKLVLVDGIDLEIKEGKTTELIATGLPKEIDKMNPQIENGTLTFRHLYKNDFKTFCLFCSSEYPHLVLTVPTLAEITAKDGTSIRSEKFPMTTSFILTLADGSYANISANLQTFTTTISDGSTLYIHGNTQKGTITVKDGSLFNGKDFKMEEAVVSTTDGSNALLDVANKLDATARDGSDILYTGSPLVIKNTSDGGDVTSRE